MAMWGAGQRLAIACLPRGAFLGSQGQTWLSRDCSRFLGTSLIAEDQLPKVLPDHSPLKIFSGSPLPFFLY